MLALRSLGFFTRPCDSLDRFGPSWPCRRCLTCSARCHILLGCDGVIGVGDPTRFRVGGRNAGSPFTPTCVWVVHGNDGLDEISTSGTTRVSELRGDVSTISSWHPRLSAWTCSTVTSVAGIPRRTPRSSAECSMVTYEADLIAVNAAAAVLVGGSPGVDLDQAMSQVRRVLSDGSAAQVLTPAPGADELDEVRQRWAPRTRSHQHPLWARR